MKRIADYRWLKRLTKSTVFLLLLFLVLTEFYLVNSEDKFGKSAAKLASNDSRIPALREAIEGKNSFEAVVLGSSLTMTALTYPDFELGLAPESQLNPTYTKALMFSELLKKNSGKTVTAINLSCLAATPADVFLIANELDKRGKLPKLIIYGIEPRALADNLTPLGGALGGAAALELKPNSSSNVAGNFWENSKYVVLSSMPLFIKSRIHELQVKLGRLGDDADKQEVQNLVLGHVWRLYGLRQEIGLVLQDRARAIVNGKWQESDFKTAEKEIPDVVTCESNSNAKKTFASNEKPWQSVSVERFQMQLEQYKAHYSPFNKLKLGKNSLLLEKLASLCQKRGVSLVLIKMPITKENQQLIPFQTSQGYDQCLNNVAQKYSCRTIDLRSGFCSADFMDTVHLNAQGGAKFQKRLASALNFQI